MASTSTQIVCRNASGVLKTPICNIRPATATAGTQMPLEESLHWPPPGQHQATCITMQYAYPRLRVVGCCHTIAHGTSLMRMHDALSELGSSQIVHVLREIMSSNTTSSAQNFAKGAHRHDDKCAMLHESQRDPATYTAYCAPGLQQVHLCASLIELPTMVRWSAHGIAMNIQWHTPKSYTATCAQDHTSERATT